MACPSRLGNGSALKLRGISNNFRLLMPISRSGESPNKKRPRQARHAVSTAKNLVVSMIDVPTPKQRSFNMSRIRSRDTKPEKIVRSIVHRLGYRYRLHKSDLRGKPDIVLVRHRKIIDVHGSFTCTNADTAASCLRRMRSSGEQNVSRMSNAIDEICANCDVKVGKF